MVCAVTVFRSVFLGRPQLISLIADRAVSGSVVDQAQDFAAGQDHPSQEQFHQDTVVHEFDIIAFARMFEQWAFVR